MIDLNALRRLADSVREIATPIRTNQLTIRTRTWSGSYRGEGTSTDEDLVIPAKYPIRYVNMREVLGSGGKYELGDILVDHITPSDGADVGYTPEQLSPEVTEQNVEILYVITGDHPGIYESVEVRTFRPFTYQLVLRRTRQTP